MQTNAKFLGLVRMWKEDEEYRWASDMSEHVPERAIEAEHYRGDDGKDVLYINWGDSGEFIYDAVGVCDPPCPDG